MYWNRFIPAVCNVAPIVLLEIEDHQIHRRRIYATDAMSESAMNLKAEQYKLIKVTPFKRMCQQPQSIPHLLQQPCVVNHPIPFIFSRFSKNFLSRINLHLVIKKIKTGVLSLKVIYITEKDFIFPEKNLHTFSKCRSRSLYFMSDFWAGCTFMSPCNSLLCSQNHRTVL